MYARSRGWFILETLGQKGGPPSGMKFNGELPHWIIRDIETWFTTPPHLMEQINRGYPTPEYINKEIRDVARLHKRRPDDTS